MQDVLETNENNDINHTEQSQNSVIIVEQSCNIENLQQVTNEAPANSSIINVPVMLSQQIQNFDSIFSLGGQEFFLNNCGTKRLIIGIASSGIPNLKSVFRLHDLKNGWSIQFNKKTWDTIVRHESTIIEYMDNGVEEDIFDNNRIRAETQFLFNRCCIQFCDLAETHVALAPETFERMMSLKDEVETIYKGLNQQIIDVSSRMKLFMDLTFFQLFKSNNIDSRHNYNWAMLQMNESTSSNFMELNASIANTWERLGKWVSNEQTNSAATNDL